MRDAVRILAFVSACIGGPAAAAERAIIVFDASGSMWGRIDGQTNPDLPKTLVVLGIPERSNSAPPLTGNGSRATAPT